MKSTLLLALCALTCAAQELRVYAIDVEGGKSTLYVSPSGQSMLVDTGYTGFKNRDADRIVAAAKAAGVTQIDYLVITHYHADHVGGVPQLAAKIPIRNFVDHGQNFETVKDNGGVYGDYVAARAKGNHIEVKAGDRIPIQGLDVEVVTASGKAIAKPLPGAGQANPLCAAYRPLDTDKGENAHSIGMVSGAPAIVQALHPKAAIMNNGPTTGASEPAWQTIHESPGRPDIWQLHYAEGNDKKHNAPAEFIANTGANCKGDWIELSARQDGSFTIENVRTHSNKDYR